MDEAVGHPLGIEAIGIFAWDKLRPQLKEAAEIMPLYGINPQEFYE